MRCCICGFDMVWRINGETHYQGKEYLGNRVKVYGYRNHLIPDANDHEGHYMGIDHSRCCDWCDRLYETPARMGMVGQAREMMGRGLIIANEMALQLYEKKLLEEEE